MSRTTHKVASLLALMAGLSGCPSTTGTSVNITQVDANRTTDVAARVNGILNRYMAMRPDLCRGAGLHDACDGRIGDYSVKGIEAREAFLRKAHEELATIDKKGLEEKVALDVTLLDLALRAELFNLEDLKLWQRRPQFYEEMFGLDGYLTRDYAPLDERVAALVRHANASLSQVQHIKANLKGPLPKSFVETDIRVYSGYAEYLRGDVQTLIKQVKDPVIRDNAAAATLKLAKHAEEIANYLKADELPRADNSHVLGVANFKKLLSVQEGMDNADLDELAKMADADLQTNKRIYEDLVAKGVTPKRPPAADLLSEARKMVDDSRQFIIDKKIVTIPDGGKLLVEETPPFMQWGSAFLNPPGALDKDGLASYYYITMPNPSWPKDEQEAYIMPFGTLLATSVHEVFPGHFLQHLWIRKAPTRATAILGSYSFIEGWAHYTEHLMIEQGFHADDPAAHLGQLGDALLRNCRFVVSIGMHTKGMTVEEAASRFERDCKQDKASGRLEAYRGTFDPGYFAYTLGKLHILRLRAEAQEKLGAKFNLQAFHDALLSHGSPPVPLIREQVLRQLGAE